MYVCIVCMYVYICIYIMYKKDLRKTTCRNIIGILKNSSFCFFHLINQHIYIYVCVSVFCVYDVLRDLVPKRK